jgi:hypothetical protein
MAIYLANADSTIMRYSRKAQLDEAKLRKNLRGEMQCNVEAD